MPLLAVLAMVSTAAPGGAKLTEALAAFHALTAEQVEAKPVAEVPSGKGWAKVDASEAVISPSHRTTLLVSAHEFYVEYGKTTHASAKAFGPFKIGEPCGDHLCAEGQVCCNQSCGICTPPGGVCIKEVCAKKVGIACGDKRCPDGEVCCNVSCGICDASFDRCYQLGATHLNCTKRAADAGT